MENRRRPGRAGFHLDDRPAFGASPAIDDHQGDRKDSLASSGGPERLFGPAMYRSFSCFFALCAARRCAQKAVVVGAPASVVGHGGGAAMSSATTTRSSRPRPRCVARATKQIGHPVPTTTA